MRNTHVAPGAGPRRFCVHLFGVENNIPAKILENLTEIYSHFFQTLLHWSKLCPIKPHTINTINYLNTQFWSSSPGICAVPPGKTRFPSGKLLQEREICRALTPRASRLVDFLFHPFKNHWNCSRMGEIIVEDKYPLQGYGKVFPKAK